MVLGANGTGKESVAQSIHLGSERREMPFVAVNCGALPRELAASLFFGHEKGAFTGADTAKTGYFDMAKGGTLFLDEIGTMSYEIQSMLLRVLQENTYTPIGSDKERVADVRIVTATMRICNWPSRKGGSGKTFTTAFANSRYVSLHWRNVRKTSSLWLSFP